MNKACIIGIILFLILCGGGLYYLENYEATYYTKIDNTKIKPLSANDDMKYEYTLECYDKKGNKKVLSFKTVRELKDEAYLLLQVRSLGVHSWQEVEYDEMPEKVQEKLK